ncbi:hypothetical protein [Tepidibacter hydrothermalis]|uniref:Tetratricopeptide repeat protein n=1 Tax=Tepidibacter hydrothermalis TaxID=3036126 RepID=A0ABY8ECU2_9FIRM|nr:hypothetical protein [Tepidibacter hydrothermalis]WFD08685.1 hypothetical protein P4S50_09750 [Tepidibacter hydrothermalis]
MIKRLKRNSSYIIVGAIGGIIFLILDEGFGIDKAILNNIFIFLVIIGSMFTIFRSIKRSKYVVSLLNDQYNVNLFLEEIEKDINKTLNDKNKKMLLINKSCGLNYKGDFEQSVEILKSIDIKGINKVFKKSYYNNFLYNLLMLDRIDEAKEMFANHIDDIEVETKYKMLDISTNHTLAAYEFYIGNLKKSREMFERLLEKDHSEINEVSTFYFLGLMDLKEKKLEEGRQKLKKSAEFGNYYFISKMAKDLLSKY